MKSIQGHLFDFLLKKATLIVFFLCIFAFFIYSYLPFVGIKFYDVDEAANFRFTEQFIKTSSFSYEEPLNKIEGGKIVHPRSTIVKDSKTVPWSFLGLPLVFGLIGKIFGLGVISYLTPLFSATAIFFFYLLIKEIFSKKIALLSCFLLAVNPAFWYFSSRTTHHNALFVDLLIMGFYFLIKIFKNKNQLSNYVLSSFFISLALIVRTSEIIWIAIVVLALLVLFRKNIKIGYLLVALVVSLIIFIPVLHYNNQLYGSPFTFGYLVPKNELPQAQGEVNRLVFLKKIFFPVGINLSKLSENTVNYLIRISPWTGIFCILGMAVFLKNIKKYSKLQKMFFYLFISLALFLIFYYGSGDLFGTRGEYGKDLTIGSSLIRYWLVLFVLAIPFSALAILTIEGVFIKKHLKIFTVPFFLILVLFFSTSIVFFEPHRGLVAIKSEQSLLINIGNQASSFMEPDSVVIAMVTDKIYFPHSKFIGENINFNILNISNELYKLRKVVPIYYLKLGAALDLGEINKKLKPKGIDIVLLEVLSDEIATRGALYKIELSGTSY